MMCRQTLKQLEDQIDQYYHGNEGYGMDHTFMLPILGTFSRKQ